jgi:hypothetical protein
LLLKDRVKLMKHLKQQMIAQEPPGVRLDAWVQENVMTVPPLFAYTQIGGARVDYPEGHRVHGAQIAVSDRALAEKVPNYSTDIANAWKIVETMNSRGWPFCIRLSREGKVIAETGRADCNAGSFYDDGNCYETVPEAICKAALLGMAGEGKSD